MSDSHHKLDRLILKQRLRKLVPVIVIILLFTGFMALALYIEYGPDAEVVDIFPEVE